MFSMTVSAYRYDNSKLIYDQLSRAYMVSQNALPQKFKIFFTKINNFENFT